MPDWLKSVIVLLMISVLLGVVVVLIAVSAAAAIAVIAVGGVVWLLSRPRKGEYVRSEYTDP